MTATWRYPLLPAGRRTSATGLFLPFHVTAETADGRPFGPVLRSCGGSERAMPGARRRAPRVVAAATPLRVGSAWTPYVGFGVEGAAIVSLPMIGPAIACSPVELR